MGAAPGIRDFESLTLDTGETAIHLERGGSGPPVLLLHGFPQTLAMWRDIAPILADRFSVVCADLRGYGASGCPRSGEDHAAYSKRALAGDMVAVMDAFGHERFSIAGHDRRGHTGSAAGVPGAWSSPPCPRRRGRCLRRARSRGPDSEARGCRPSSDAGTCG
jgi:pimeloyl-ACP methyl ester carboxylesterase